MLPPSVFQSNPVLNTQHKCTDQKNATFLPSIYSTFISAEISQFPSLRRTPRRRAGGSDEQLKTMCA